MAFWRYAAAGQSVSPRTTTAPPQVVPPADPLPQANRYAHRNWSVQYDFPAHTGYVPWLGYGGAMTYPHENMPAIPAGAGLG